MQPCPAEELGTNDTSCPSRTSAEHFDCTILTHRTQLTVMTHLTIKRPGESHLALDGKVMTHLTIERFSCRQVVYQSGQPVAFCKFPELRQWQHHHDDSVHQKELGWIDTQSIELSPCKATRKPTKTTTKPKDTQNTETKTKPNKTTNNHGTVVISWSVNRN